MNDYGKRLRIIRKEMGLSQEKMARKLEANTSSYRRYEKCEYSTPSDLLIKFDKLGYSIDWLLTGNGNPRKDGSRPETVTKKDSMLEAPKENLVFEAIIAAGKLLSDEFQFYYLRRVNGERLYKAILDVLFESFPEYPDSDQG